MHASWIELEWPGMWRGAQLGLPESLRLRKLFLFFYSIVEWGVTSPLKSKEKGVKLRTKRKDPSDTFQFFYKQLAVI